MDNNSVNLIKKTYLFKGIPDDELIPLISELEISEKSYEKNEVVFLEEDPASFIYILKSGNALSEKIYEEGDFDILSAYEPGDIIGLEAFFSTFKSMPFTLISSQESTFLLISARKFYSFAGKDILLNNMVNILADNNIRNLYKVEVLSKYSIKEKLLTYLKIMKLKKGSSSFDIGMNQEQLAKYLCVDRSALSNELNKLRRKGIIDYKGSFFKL